MCSGKRMSPPNSTFFFLSPPLTGEVREEAASWDALAPQLPVTEIEPGCRGRQGCAAFPPIVNILRITPGVVQELGAFRSAAPHVPPECPAALDDARFASRGILRRRREKPGRDPSEQR